MKPIIFFLLLLIASPSLEAQLLDTVRIVHKPPKFKARKHILMRFEKLDTIDVRGQTITISRSYYFDKKQRMISSVRQYDNPKKPANGTQVIYSFAKNHLTAVIVIPPRKTCLNCASEYYFSGDTLFTKRERVYKSPDPGAFLLQAYSFRSKFPPYLPWGYFEDEVLVNGKMKRLSSGY
jgi:hypothetical protein